MDGSAANKPSVPINAQNTPLFTCMACQVAFHSADQQRTHYRSDWHRYNLKRKVAELPPVTAENFAQRMLAQQAKAAEDTRKATFTADCDVCHKTYSSENAFNNHLNSKKHKEAEARMIRRMQNDELKKADREEAQAKSAAAKGVGSSPGAAAMGGNNMGAAAPTSDASGEMTTTEGGLKVSDFPISDDDDESDDEDIDEANQNEATEASTELSTSAMEIDEQQSAEDAERLRRKQEREINQQLDKATTEAEVLELLEKKKKAAPRLNPDSDCLFCTHTSNSFDENMNHMTVAHSFFVPDLEYIVDLHGLIKYLADKISVANVCLFCNGRGRGLRSLEAVRQHMQDKGHVKIAYETEIDVLEISDYYDFSSTYPDADQEHDVDEELDSEAISKIMRHGTTAEVFEEDGELVLPNGNRIGHRSLKHYYMQYLAPERKEKDSVVIHKMLTNYAENPELSNKLVQSSKNRALVMARPNGRQAWKDMATFKEYRARHEYQTRMGMRSNGLMRHFRMQNPI